MPLHHALRPHTLFLSLLLSHYSTPLSHRNQLLVSMYPISKSDREIGGVCISSISKSDRENQRAEYMHVGRSRPVWCRRVIHRYQDGYGRLAERRGGPRALQSQLWRRRVVAAARLLWQPVMIFFSKILCFVCVVTLEISGSDLCIRFLNLAQKSMAKCNLWFLFRDF